MAKSAVVKLVAETKQYDRSIDNAAKKLQDFGKNGPSSLAPMLGAWGKLVPAIGAAVGGMASFDKAMQSSQALGDAYARVQAELSTSVDNFFVSLTSGDWSAFDQGLNNVIRKAGLAQDAIDQLGNSTMSLSVTNAKENLELQKQMTILRGATKGSQEYNDALAKANEIVGRMSSATGIVQGDQWNAIATRIASWTNLNSSDVQFDWVLKAQTLDATTTREEDKKNARARVEEYNKELGKLDREFYTSKWFGEGDTQQVLRVGKTMDEYNERVKALNAEYGESITIVTLLDRKNDESLKGINDLTLAYYNNEAAIESNRQSLARLGKETPKKNNNKNEVAYDHKGTAIAAPGGLSMPVTASSSFFSGLANNEGFRDSEERLISLGSTIGDLHDEWNSFQSSLKVEGLSTLADAFGTLGSAIGGTTGMVMKLISTMAQQVIQSMVTISTLKAEESEHLANMTAVGGEAAAKAMAAHSSIPFVGVAIGVGMVATIIATLMSLPKFATGGIVGGNDHNDGILARVSSGEMILNEGQQANLLRMINNGAMGTSQSSEIKVRIENNQLVGTLSNAARRSAYTAQ